MKFTQLTEQNRRDMLETLGVSEVTELFAAIPSAHRLDAPLNIPPGLSEPEILADLTELARRNHACDELVCFLGGGAYDHFIPTVVDHLAMKGEFLTAYTPYQAEASQGSLQAFYEFQTMVCQLLGMDVANASLYEQASAVAEAVLMVTHASRHCRVLISGAVHPDTSAVLNTYARQANFQCTDLPMTDGVTDLDALTQALGDQTAAVVLQTPNFFGCLEPAEEIAQIAHQAGAAVIGCTDPLACGVIKRPGDWGADIAVAEGQALGIPLSYGGPYIGLLACGQKWLRKMPGRVVGRGPNANGGQSFCLALQTREQHIRRERATSNICTNQGLMAMRVAVYLAAMGRAGIATVSSQCLDKAHYAADCIAELRGYGLRFDRPFFKEFTVQTDRNVSAVLAHCRRRGILAGLPLGRWFEPFGDCFTLAVTEQRSKAQIDQLVEALKTA